MGKLSCIIQVGHAHHTSPEKRRTFPSRGQRDAATENGSEREGLASDGCRQGSRSAGDLEEKARKSIPSQKLQKGAPFCRSLDFSSVGSMSESRSLEPQDNRVKVLSVW